MRGGKMSRFWPTQIFFLHFSVIAGAFHELIVANAAFIGGIKSRSTCRSAAVLDLEPYLIFFHQEKLVWCVIFSFRRIKWRKVIFVLCCHFGRRRKEEGKTVKTFRFDFGLFIVRKKDFRGELEGKCIFVCSWKVFDNKNEEAFKLSRREFMLFPDVGSL